MRAAILIALVGCSSYAMPRVDPVAARATSPSTHARIGCFDFDIARTQRVPTPTLTYRVTNACDHEATVDFARIYAVAVTPDGAWQPLHTMGFQHYQWSYRIDPQDSRVAERTFRGGGLSADTEICVDLGTADEALAYAPRWTCVHY